MINNSEISRIINNLILFLNKREHNNDYILEYNEILETIKQNNIQFINYIYNININIYI